MSRWFVGLVQEQHVRTRHQGARQRRPRELPGREPVERPLQLLLADAEPAQHALHPRPPCVASRPLQARLGLLVGPQHVGSGVARGHPRLEVGQLPLGAGGPLDPLGHVALQREAGAEGRTLVVKGDGRPLGQAHAPAVGVQAAREDAQQRGLALAVAAHHGQAVAGVHAEADVPQDVPRAEALAELDGLHDRLG